MDPLTGNIFDDTPAFNVIRSSPTAPVAYSNDQYRVPYTPIGLPPDPMSSLPPPGLESTNAAIQSGPVISSLTERIWNTIKNDSRSVVAVVETEAKNVYGGMKDVTKTAYVDASSAVGTVYDDLSKPVKNMLTGTYWYLILGLVAVGGVLYVVGKGGAIGQATGR